MMGLAKDLHDAFGLPVVLGALFPRTPSRELAPLYYSRLGDDAPGPAGRSRAEEEAANLAAHRRMLGEFFAGALSAPHQAARAESAPSVHVAGYWTMSVAAQLKAFEPSDE